ncbi:MAG TPA: glycogen debranching N-terminal domain-containing protein [Thermoleophilaceae bacterium]|nr:glycogen debranching N-terminal domain-containing protein [Thermoleophilaceae bacterium]
MNLADALVIKRENLFMVAPRDGRLPGGAEQPLGLWYRDCRFLSVHELLLDGRPPILLQASDAGGTRAVHELSNDAGVVSVRIERTLEEPLRLRERVVLHSHGEEAVGSELAVRLAADFVPMLAVRGLVPRPDRRVEATVDERGTRFALQGRDGVLRSTTVQASEPPASCDGSDGDVLLRFQVELQPGRACPVELIYTVAELSAAGAAGSRGGRAAARPPGKTPVHAAPPPDPKPVHAGAPPERTIVRSDDELFDRVLGRSLADLDLLRSDLDGRPYYAAGVPWFATLFGRDSLIAATQMLAFVPEVAAGTLRALGDLIGRAVDDTRDEEPGKIPHELRVGEPATLGETPFARYYGSVDATPLWLCLLCDHADWTGDPGLFRELRPQVDAALAWLDRHGDLDGDGLLEYRRRAPGGLVNQGWRDSPSGVPDAGGRPRDPPVALVEVQAYAVRALRGVARLMELEGEDEHAGRLRGRGDTVAAALEGFWLAGERRYAIGLDGAGRPGSGLTSNQGHLLWAGAAPAGRAGAIRDALMGAAMFSGWGVRTVGEGHAGYNPLGYHTGSVWPHDTALIAAGLRRYGFDEDFRTLFEGLLQAASLLPGHRMPELFGGLPRRADEAPVPYPVACRPQAWAAGAIPLLVATGLGLVPDALAGRLRVVRPLLPRWVGRLSLEGLRVGDARVDLRFERAGKQVVLAGAHTEGTIELVLEAE